MNNITEIMSRSDFDKIINEQTPVVVDFFANWCAPCKMQAPILYEFSQEIGEKAKVIKVDVDQCPEIAVRYNVETIPTLIVFKNGEQKEKTIGLTPKAQIAEMLIKYV